MNTPFEFTAGDETLVYIKAVPVSDLPAEIRRKAGDAHHLYAVHNASGEQLALVANRELAFVLARQNDMTPVTVH